MFCRNCGKEIPDTSKFCPYCGTEKEGKPEEGVPARQAAPPPEPPSHTQQPEQQLPDQQQSYASAPEQQPYAPQPQPQPQPYAQQPSQQPYAQQPQPQPYASPEQQPYAQQQPYAPPQQQPALNAPDAQQPQAPPKKGSKAPLIIIAAVVALLAIGGVVLVATGALSNLFTEKSAVAALYVGTENLVYDTSSATVEVQAGVDMTLKWDLGEDLAHSKVWGYSGGAGFVFADDTLCLYASGGDPLSSGRAASQTTIITEESDVIDEMNRAFKDEYGVDVDLNRIVKNSRFDRDYLEEVNRIISEADVDSSAFDTYGLNADDIDTVKITEIIDSFMSSEVNKEDVYEKFMSDIEKDRRGDVTSHRATVDPAAFFNALGDYASERGKDADYADAAAEILSLCEGASLLKTYITDFTIEISVQKNVLVGLDLGLNMPNGAFSVTATVTDLNSTDLDNDEELQAILSSPSSGTSGISLTGASAGMGTLP